MTKRSIVAGNWKMNILPSNTSNFIDQLKPYLTTHNTEVVICPPFTHLQSAQQSIYSNQLNLKLAAQDCSEQEQGAYTGEISASMCSDLQCSYVLIGHSERRERNSTEDSLINSKLQQLLSKNLKAILCCGEPKSVRENNNEYEFVQNQLDIALTKLPADSIANIIIAYEPIWAIGTGLTATNEQAQMMHEFIRNCINKLYNESVAKQLKILYGGSVKAGNADGLATQPDIDGVLVGGASLIADDFGKIIRAFDERK
ncbi:MAG TPA: triose-phosphate isomerase [Saprospiraceae bacterium]|nr:triose-phosphate isomerase [Saprospiraceae bacterium]